MSFSIGVDVGGTFTDFLVVEEESEEHFAHKLPSTPDDPSIGVMTGLREIAERLSLSQEGLLEQTSLIIHGTTVATNAVLTDRGAVTGLLTTEGFRDVLEMRRGVRSRKHLYDNKYVPPRPLVPRHLRQPVRERVDVNGTIVESLDEQAVVDGVKQLQEEGVEAISICFMHAHLNPTHEHRAKQIVQETAPELFLSISSEVMPQIRLYNRVGTTAMNSYVGPVVERYMRRLVQQLENARFGGALLVMQSSGGVATADSTSRFPAATVLSGPAAAPVAGQAYVSARNEKDCIVVDMGGTSFDASLVKDAEIQVTQEGEINRQPISLPMTDIHTIGAGGGSIGWLDEGRLLRVGPQSAGAYPGPVAYGQGGAEPTVTDADLVLGYLNPEYFLNGRMNLRVDLAREAIEGQLARPLGLDSVEAAAGMYEVVNFTMAAGIKDISVQRGYDPREFPLIFAGGAGPVHAGMIAEELDNPFVIVPRLSSIFCATGMLLADLRHDFVRSHNELWANFDAEVAREIIEDMIAEGGQSLSEEGVDEERQKSTVAADIRYVGQHHEVTVTFPLDRLNSDSSMDSISEAFHRRHEELYGFSLSDNPLQVINLRVTVLGQRRGFQLDLPEANGDLASLPRKGRRAVYLKSEERQEEVDIFDGNQMQAGQRIEGPAVVEEATTTVFVPVGFDLDLDHSGNFVLHKKGQEVDDLVDERRRENG